MLVLKGGMEDVPNWQSVLQPPYHGSTVKYMMARVLFWVGSRNGATPLPLLYRRDSGVSAVITFGLGWRPDLVKI